MAHQICMLLATTIVFIQTSLQNEMNHPDEAGARYINEWALHVDGSISDAKAIARQLGFIYYRPIHHMEGHHVVRRPERIMNFSKLHHYRLRRHAKVRWFEQQKAKVRRKRGDLTFNDPMYNQQWYLHKGAQGGYDMNVMAAWKRGYTGKGVVITILDDGIEYTHPDLSKNYDPEASFDINDNDKDPMPRSTFDNENKHGTRCAGEVASGANNKLCNVGVAYNARIGGVRMLDGDITDSVEGLSLGLRQNHIDIYSGSWGPDDNGKVVDGPGVTAKAAFEKGVHKGRNGLGNIFVWASGNGGLKKDSCACDGYAGSIYTLSVSSVSEHNKKPWYLEECASTLTSTYSSGYSGERQIITTDLYKSCTDRHTGTSASAPLAAGIIALVLEANRNLTWRDVQYITLLTSNPAPFVDAAWITNGVGRNTSLLYGYGLMDAGKMVYLAPLWRRTPAQHQCGVTKTFNKPLYGKVKATVVFDAGICAKKDNGAKAVIFVEHVLLYLSLTYTRRGDLRIILISPAGTRSVILPPRQLDSVGGPTKFDRWPLMSVQFWGENVAGQWHMEIENVGHSNNAGKLVNGQLVIYGVAVQPIRLRPAVGSAPDWFKKDFQRFVVSDSAFVSKSFDENKKGGTSGKCHEECANSTACSGERANQCESCRHFKVSSDGSCVAKCPPETFPAQHLCQSCHLQCAKCTGPSDQNCTECHSGSALIPSQHRCLSLGEPCPHGTYLSNDKRKCLPCAIHCESCASLKRCYQCRIDNGTWVLSPTGQCVRACPARYFVSSDRRCLPCPSSCVTCISGREDGCTSCASPKLLLKTNSSSIAGNCVSHCLAGFFLERSTNICLRCHESCKSCRGASMKDCVTCREPLVLHEKICLDPADVKCKNGKYKKSSQCLNCHPSCERCEGGSAANCLECRSPSSVFYHGYCQSKCPDGMYAFNRTDKYAVRGMITNCVYCHALCALCHGPTASHCTRCHPGLILTPNGACQPRCPIGSFNRGSGSVCEPCLIKGCAVCSSTTKCLKCRRGLMLVNGRCETRHICPKGYGALNGRCVPCPDIACEDCSGNELRNCTRCRGNHYRDSSGKCLPPQPCHANEFRDKDLVCRPCHTLCRTCSGPGNQDCTSCPPSSCFVIGVCRPCCSSSTSFPTVPFPCANCTISPTPSCVFLGVPSSKGNYPGNSGFFQGLPGPTRLLIIVAFITCGGLPLAYVCIFCALQARSGEPMCYPGLSKGNKRPAGPDYAPLSTNSNGSPEKGSFCDDDLEMNKMTDVVIQTPFGGGKDSDESSGVGSSPDKSPDMNEGLDFKSL